MLPFLGSVPYAVTFGWWKRRLETTAFPRRLRMVPSYVFHEKKDEFIFLELLTAFLPLLVFAPLLSGHRFIVASDNTRTVSFLNRGTTKNLKALVRLKKLFETSVKYNFRFSAQYTSGADNLIADSMSRFIESPHHELTFLSNVRFPLPGDVLPKLGFRSYPTERSQNRSSRTLK